MQSAISRSIVISLKGSAFNPPISSLLSNVLFNQFFVVFPALFVLQEVLAPLHLGVHVSRELPPVPELLLHLILEPIAVEIGFYFSHKWLHSEHMYASVHKVHHSYKSPHALAAIYAHPIEALVGNTLCVMGPAFFLRFHLLSWYMAVFIGWISTCNGHAGYALPWARSIAGFRDFHDFHHEVFTGNYSAGSTRHTAQMPDGKKGARSARLLPSRH